jgi:hypothetical protein
MAIELFCPFNKKCEETKRGKILRCSLFTKVTGKKPQSEEQIEQWGCAFSWLPVLLIENAQTNRGQTAALESFRNETVKQQTTFNQLASIAAKTKLLDRGN